MTTTSYVICTRNRPHEIKGCLDSIRGLREPPHEVIVVDSGDSVEHLVADVLGMWGTVVYLRSEPGLPHQRNVGVAAATGDIVCFIDDDVELDPTFNAELQDVFDADPLAFGVQATVVNDTLPTPVMSAFRRLFLLRRNVRDEEGRMLPSGYFTTPITPTVPRPSEVLRGCGMAFRREVFTTYSFDERLAGYAFKEDVDFSYRVSREHRLVIAPGPRLIHHETPVARLDTEPRTRMHIVNNHILFKKNLASRRIRWVAFWWAMLGRLLFALINSVGRRDPGYVRGTLSGLAAILRPRRDPVSV